MKKIICLYGGPGSGKSTTCAGLFYRLKQKGYDCEMNREYYKEWVWEIRNTKPGDQTYIFAKQSRKERIYIENNLDIIITDSPLILTNFYGQKYDEMEQLSNTSLVMLKHHHEFCKKRGYKTDHFFINRVSKYNPNGRNQTEKEAKALDTEIREYLNGFGINTIDVTGDETSVPVILKHLGVA